LAAVGLLGLAALIGLPMCGADFGGMVGALAGFGAACLVWWRGNLRLRDVLLALAAGVIMLFATLALDLARGGAQQTHLARVFTSGESLFDVALRKSAMNVYLFTHSPWALGLLTSAGAIWMLMRQPDSRLRVALASDRILRGADIGLVVGAA